MLHTWAVAPGRAARLAAAQRSDAQVVVFGHVHFPGVWLRGGRTIINTGAFCPPLGALMVDLKDARVQVRRVDFRGKEFRPGALVADFALAPATAAATLPLK
jgi:predicted phosphodiesterase